MSEPDRTSTGAVLAAVAVGVWAVGVTLLVQGLGWLGEQVLIYYTGGRPGWAWPVASLANAALVAAPATMLALVPRSAVVRAAGRAWLAGAAGLGLLGMVRAVPAAESELHLALLALAAGGLALALGLALRRGRPAGPGAVAEGFESCWRERSAPLPPAALKAASDQGPTPGQPAVSGPGQPAIGGPGQPAVRGPVLFAAGAGLVMLLPWLWVGALGGVLETLLAVVAAGAVGWLAGTVLGHRFWARFRGSRPRLVLVGGLAAGVTLLLIAAGTGGSGGQLPLLLTLPPLGFVAAALAAGRSRWPVPVLVGLATLGALALVDPEEVSLLLATSRDVPFWVAVGTATGLATAGLLAAAYPLGLARPRPRWLAATVAGVALLAAGAVYAGPGQPGWYGERLFVVLSGAPDLSGLPAGAGQAGRDARATEVYRRLVAHAQASQAGLHAELDRLGLAYTPYYLVNAVEIAGGGPAVRAWLSRRGEVDRVLHSQRLRPLPAAGGGLAASSGLTPDRPEWNIELVGADQVWDQLGVTGEGIVVGSSDSGVDGSHPALADGFRGGDDSWLDPWNGSTVPTDRNGHGTHTLGSAVGRGGIGVAPGAQWTGCANLDRGLGNPARYLDCLQFMLAPYPAGGDPWRDGRPDRAPHVLTNSWSCPPIEGCDESVLRPATRALAAAGIYPVVAAGNTGPFCRTIQDPPATYPEVLTVGAVDRDGEVAAFSSRGPVPGDAGKPDLVAPGAGVVSAVPGGGYRALDGTSMATPHLAGVVALIWSANPALVGDVAATTRILLDTARPVTPEEPDCGDMAALAGAGLVDAHAAVLAARGG